MSNETKSRLKQAWSVLLYELWHDIKRMGYLPWIVGLALIWFLWGKDQWDGYHTTQGLAGEAYNENMILRQQFEDYVKNQEILKTQRDNNKQAEVDVKNQIASESGIIEEKW